jgi:hypothetical protein
VYPCAAPARSSDDSGWPGQSKYSSRVWRLGDQRGHRHAVDDDEPGLRNYRRHLLGPQQQHAARRQPAAADHTDAGIGDLSLTGLAAQLRDRFVQQTHAVGSAM